ncbi:MAG: tRNA pseudouridine(13) synthase TruD [Phycisphaerae bacterium]|jgi:tRNA pseudouridine13 synthase
MNEPGDTAPHAADASSHVAPARFLTEGIPGTGGVIKQRPEDFLVDEMPLYQPCGEGEHLYMLVQKRELSTFDAVDIIARHFGVRRDAVGFAGLKDKHAITRQVFSVHVPGRAPEDFPMLRHDRLGVMWVDRHANKLRRGHLKGNRFSIRIREVSPGAVVHASRTLRELKAKGVPNRVGEQRFGLLGNNHLVGRAILRGDFQQACDLLLGPEAAHPDINPEARGLYAAGRFAEAIDALPRNARAERTVLARLSHGALPRNAILAVDETSLAFFISATQSAIFNATLDRRLEAGTFATLAAGDVAMKLDNRATFLVDEATAADPSTAARLAAFEVAPTGPFWGPEMRRAEGDADALELETLASFALTPETFANAPGRLSKLVEGERRSLRVPLIDPEIEAGVDEHGAYIRCAFELPRGCFATVVMREVMKPREELEEHGS